MLRFGAAVILAAFFVIQAGAGSGIAWAGDGKATFESLHCATCHKPDQKSTGASLSDIAKAYPDGTQLVKFFAGDAKPVIESQKSGLMNGQMPRLKALSDDEKQALADYILGFK